MWRLGSGLVSTITKSGWLTQIADHHVNYDHLVQSRNGWQSKLLVRSDTNKERREGMKRTVE